MRFEDGVEYRVIHETITDHHLSEVLKRNDPFYNEHQAIKQRELKEFDERMKNSSFSPEEKAKRKELLLLTL